MSCFAVNISMSYAVCDELKNVMQKLGKLEQRLNDASCKRGIYSNASVNIQTAVNKCITAVRQEKAAVGMLSTRLNNVVRQYDTAEVKVIGGVVAAASNIRAAFEELNIEYTTGKETKTNTNFWRTGSGKILKSAFIKIPLIGVISSGNDIVKSVEGFFEFDIPERIETVIKVYKNVTGIKKNISKIKDIISSSKKIIEANKKIKEISDLDYKYIGKVKSNIRYTTNNTIKKLLGLDDSLSPAEQVANVFLKDKVVIQPFGARFVDQFSNSIKKATENLKKPAGIVTSVLTVITNGVDNYKEFKSGKISADRAVAETIMESAIDIGTGILVGAAVTAGLAATIGSAPVLAVAAISTGVTVGVNAVCKTMTKVVMGEEKGVTETISDFAIDTYEMINDSVKNVKNIFNIGSKVISAVFGG